jgi:hypothetical protein
METWIKLKALERRVNNTYNLAGDILCHKRIPRERSKVHMNTKIKLKYCCSQQNT